MAKFDVRRYTDEWLPFALSYCCTVHKSQGDQFENVLLFDECDRDWKPFMYSGSPRG